MEEIIDRCQLDPADDFYKMLARGAFEVYYQPVIDLTIHGDRVTCVSVEALLRVIIDRQVYVAGTFIDRYRRFPDVRVALSRFVISRVLSDLEVIPDKTLQVRVNLFAEDLTFKPFIEWVLKAIEGSERRIIIEISESETIDDSYADTLFQFKRAGVYLSLDDWGRESSNVSRLFCYPDEMKIDKMFCPGYFSDSLKGCLICVFAAKMFGSRIVVEGIEDKEQLLIVKSLGVDYGQGFLWSRALPLDRLIRDFL